ncbi:hypothetical protein [Maricaulis maris]|uniref:Uncharacterized protein n=1 Tax=Maricaulis maris TaxID=74318 RepID=A0A495D2Q9_9PROT|nr:hypothetical protein [Maricaulis maris]RKQ96043.1 hypothetical protein C7435_2294 [Maricaulis maris]
MHRYAVTLLIALFASLAGFAGFNALIDPFGIMGSPDLPGLTVRDTRLYEDGGRVHVGDQLARGGERALILGSSRTVDGFPRDPADLPDGFINAGMRGTNIFELSQAAALAAGSETLQCVVIGLDLDEFGTHSKAKATYWLSALRDGNADFARARVALSPSTFGASIQLIADNLTGSQPRVPWADTYPAGAQRTRYESGARGIYRFYLGYRFDPERLALFETVLDRLTAEGVQVIGFIHPLHAWREEALFRAGRGDDYLAFRTALADTFARHADREPVDACLPGDGAQVWDFSGFRPFAAVAAPGADATEAHPTFYEPSHYLPNVGADMLAVMAGDRPHDARTTGDRLSPETMGATSAAIEARRAAWLATEDGRAVTAMLDAVAAGNPSAELETPQFLNGDDEISVADKLARIAPRAARR